MGNTIINVIEGLPDSKEKTFLFTDVVGSTRLWESSPQKVYLDIILQEKIITETVNNREGTVFKTVGDEVCSVFSSKKQAILAAIEAQEKLRKSKWNSTEQITVRMGISSGEAIQRNHDYFGRVLNRVSRIESLAKAGQILISEDSVEQDFEKDFSITPLGSISLRSINRPINIMQVNYNGQPSDFGSPIEHKNLKVNMPLQLNKFIGRDIEIKRLNELIQNCNTRFLTVTGIGGIGKTRLAVEFAQKCSFFSDGIYFIDLSSLDDYQLIPLEIASVLELDLDFRKEKEVVFDFLINEIKQKHTLLIFDNFEHLIEGKRYIHEILNRTEKSCVLITSREPLLIPGEIEYPLLPFQEDSILSDSVNLFKDRALSIKPSFSINEKNLKTIQEIIRKAEGIPLAIELAACHIRYLMPQEILSIMGLYISHAKGANYYIPERHMTLYNMVNWSYRTLSEKEKTVLKVMSPFYTIFSLDIASMILSQIDQTIDARESIEQLVLKNLIVFAENENSGGYSFIQIIRTFALKCLNIDDSLLQMQKNAYSFWIEETWVLEFNCEELLNNPDFLMKRKNRNSFFVDSTHISSAINHLKNINTEYSICYYIAFMDKIMNTPLVHIIAKHLKSLFYNPEISTSLKAVILIFTNFDILELVIECNDETETSLDEIDAFLESEGKIQTLVQYRIFEDMILRLLFHKTDKGITLLKRSFEIAKENHWSHQIAMCSNNLADYYLSEKEYVRAESLLSSSIKTSQDANNFIMLFLARTTLSICYSLWGRMEQASEQLKKNLTSKLLDSNFYVQFWWVSSVIYFAVSKGEVRKGLKWLSSTIASINKLKFYNLIEEDLKPSVILKLCESKIESNEVNFIMENPSHNDFDQFLQETIQFISDLS